MAKNAQIWANELSEYLEGVEAGFIVGLEIATPPPWPPAAIIISLSDAGRDAKAIAAETGYSKPTVDRVLRTRGVDPRVGPQCDRYAGRVFRMQDAIAQMPLPCGPECVCHWRPIFRSDYGY